MNLRAPKAELLPCEFVEHRRMLPEFTRGEVVEEGAGGAGLDEFSLSGMNSVPPEMMKGT